MESWLYAQYKLCRVNFCQLLQFQSNASNSKMQASDALYKISHSASNLAHEQPETVFLVMCNPSMDEL
jgi:hypothetical protein